MISYWFDINILGKINLHMSQNVVLYLQNVKKWLFQVFFTLIINIKGNVVFFIHFWHQTCMALVLVMSI